MKIKIKTLLMSITLLGFLVSAPFSFAQTAKSNCVITKIGNPAGPPILPPACEQTGETGVCVPGGVGKDGAFQALTPGEQTLFSPWGVPRSGGRTHKGVDLGRASGTPIFAIEPGIVTRVSHDDVGLGGVTVSMKGDSGRRHYFAHLILGSNNHITVGELLTKCQQIGQVGQTGNARTTPPHLHYQISNRGGTWVNPVIELAGWPNL